MAFEISKEQKMIQKMAREFGRKELAEAAMDRDHTGEYPKEILRKMGELGLLGMLVPEEYDGEDMGTVAYSLALTEIAYYDASVAVIMSVHNSIGCGSLVRFGSNEQKEKYLKPMAKGEIIASFALSEPEAGSDPAGMTATAEKDGDSYVLNGTKRWITGGATSGVFIILAKTDPSAGHKGISAFLIEPDTPGFIVGRKEEKMGLKGSDTTDLIFDNCRVPASTLLGKEGEGFLVAMSGLDDGRIGIGSQSLGVGMRALDLAVDYARQRHQFGKPIAANQGLRWMIADMATEVEAARLLVLNAAAMKDRGEKCSKEASMAKMYASEMANHVAAQSLQIHGGYGYTKEFEIERLYRDARVFTIYEGTTQVQKIVISGEVIGDKKRKKK
ncbi:acyl-CoA dehydrogenase family protein [Desulfobotulus sp. H1]|uniref:Acyl-CoA dehydrogenase family protein n=1 Tax=Desulfobotulus pelophilus TaxID=2823377 RepID=A0ABT3N6K9_9BACT|nr:acyl-CoA dehydrogenase family protein [Desulfobotulus pelophilus]MCW7752672.1 acyl-CoA dehydrogenase family protein [Desulfobotulus pelophilus]